MDWFERITGISGDELDAARCRCAMISEARRIRFARSVAT